MPILELKPTHKVIKDYYQEINQLLAAGHLDEGAVAPIFGNLLRQCTHQLKWQLVEQKRIAKGVIPDGVCYDELNFPRGLWEAKDTKDDLDTEITKKFARGYPKDNILFQSPERLVIYQNRDTPVFDESIRDHPEQLVAGLKRFFGYEKPQIKAWQAAVEEFQGKIADLGQRLVKIIDEAQRKNKRFKEAFERFTEQCRKNINPNLAVDAVKEMLIQHLLTERIFTNIFNNPEFVQKNVIAREIDHVIQALTSQSFSKAEFIKENQLDKFYTVLEHAAATIDDYGDKQTFLNTVYERFFQGFAVKVADTHGIVYTPQPIVEFMVKSVEEILQREFGKSLASEGVHIIDPFVGTGNFIVKILREIRQLNATQLKAKYQNELHCNEVMLLPYYIACMNIEHAFYELTGEYQPFEGICLVDTFELIEDRQMEMFVPENTKRVQRQKEAPIFVIIGNPPYNVGQQNENDNNKNRKYPKLDKMVVETYAKDSKATNKNALSDVYVKAFKWATWRLEGRNEGIIAFVSNNSFLENIAFDGMRSYLEKEFSKIYVLDLGGNVRKNPKLSGTTHNVFGIQVGVSVALLVKKGKNDAP